MIFTVKFCVWCRIWGAVSCCFVSFILCRRLMLFGRGICQDFMYFCFGLLGLSGMDILSLPVSRRGVRYFFLKCFLSDNPRK